MGQIYKKVIETLPTASVLTDAYTVPAATNTVISSISICNENSTAVTARMSHAVAGAANSLSQYFIYDITVPGHDVLFLTVGISMQTTDKIRVLASASNVAFSAWGSEIS